MPAVLAALFLLLAHVLHPTAPPASDGLLAASERAGWAQRAINQPSDH